MSTTTSYMDSVKLGIERGFCVQPLISPIHTAKTLHQFSSKKTHQIIQELYQKEGICGFYKGFPHQLLITCIKQTYAWPLIAHFPPYLKSCGASEIPQQVLTGIAITFLDSLVTPLERGRIHAIISAEKIKFSIPEMYKNGWQGYRAHLAKLSTVWITFLIAQKYFRGPSDEPRTLPELAKIGAQVALTVSLVSAPVDFANTHMQAENRSISYLFSKHNFRTFFRGSHLNLLSLLIHNFASSIVMDKLSSN